MVFSIIIASLLIFNTDDCRWYYTGDLSEIKRCVNKRADKCTSLDTTWYVLRLITDKMSGTDVWGGGNGESDKVCGKGNP